MRLSSVQTTNMLKSAVLLVLTLLAGSARAEELGREPSAREVVVAYNTGLRAAIEPGILLPSGGGRVGFSLAADVRYGFELGPTIVAPGVRITGYFPSDAFGLTALATTRLTVPVGLFGPFIVGGLGPGHLSEPSHTGLAWLGGGGLMIHIGASFGIGAQAYYQGITGSGFRSLSLGPTLLLSF